MAEKQSTRSALWPTILLLLPALLNTTLAQTNDELEEMNYDWSTFLLLVIPVLIILVVLVLCVTGVFMFCLSTLTISYDQDYIGHMAGAQNLPESRLSIPNPYTNNEKDCLNQTQCLPVSEEVKLEVEELKEFDDLSVKSEKNKEKERTDLNLNLELEAHSEEDERESVPSGTGRLEQVVVEVEQHRERDEATVQNDTKSKHISSRWVYPYSPDFPSILTKYEQPTLAASNFPSLQLMSMQYFQPQNELCLIDSVGVRG